jgi:hypothetical protein
MPVQFWYIISLGIAIPTTVILIINFVTVAQNAFYELEAKTTFLFYVMCVFSWALFVGIFFRG